MSKSSTTDLQQTVTAESNLQDVVTLVSSMHRNAAIYDLQDKKYKKEYPLIDWGWYREDCVSAIEQEGLPLPGKSSCFF